MVGKTHCRVGEGKEEKDLACARCLRAFSWALDPSAQPARHSRRWIVQLIADDADCATVERRRRPEPEPEPERREAKQASGGNGGGSASHAAQNPSHLPPARRRRASGAPRRLGATTSRSSLGTASARRWSPSPRPCSPSPVPSKVSPLVTLQCLP